MPSHRTLLELTRRYREPHRYYHGLEHIAWLFAQARDLTLSDEQVLAIWFHDAVYDPRSRTNEEDSARLAQRLLTAEGYPAASVDVVARIVLDTKDHVPTSEPAQLVVDLDLAPLAAPWPTFVANGDKIRREYLAFSEAEFATGRREFFGAMLARKKIFTTPWGRQHEAPARDNMARVLNQG